MKKSEFEKIIEEWLLRFLKNRYSKDYDVKVTRPNSNLSKIALKEIKTIERYSSFEFKPDILGILSHKKSKKIKLIFLNRSISAISLKDIGELRLYSNLAKPELSLIASPKGLPEEINLLLLDKKIQESLLNYEKDKSIILFRWVINKNNIDKISIFPISKRKEF